MIYMPSEAFKRTAWFLKEYASVFVDAGLMDDSPDGKKACAEYKEMLELACHLEAVNREWENKQAAGTTADAAIIVSNMLNDWKLPAAVWWHPARRRWRVTGEGYRMQRDEVCVGVYSPGASAAMLREDFEAVASAITTVDGSSQGQGQIK